MKRSGRFFLAAATVSLLVSNCFYVPALAADSTAATPPADGVVLMGSGKNNFVRNSDNLVYLKGGTLFVTVKQPSSGITVATRYGIVKVPRDAYVMVSLSGDRFVAQALKVGSSKVRVALSQRSFPDVKDRVVDLNEKEEMSATAKEPLTVTDSGVAPAPAQASATATKRPNEAGAAPQDAQPPQQAARQNAPPTIIQAAPNPGSGAMNVATMTAAGLAATGGILSIVGASRQMQNTGYMNGLRDMAYMQPYMNTANWKIPDIKNTNTNTLNEKDKPKPKPDDKSDDKSKLDKAEEEAKDAVKKAEEEMNAADQKKADAQKDDGKDDDKKADAKKDDDDDGKADASKSDDKKADDGGKKAGDGKDDDKDDDKRADAGKSDNKDDDDRATAQSSKSPDEQDKDDQDQANSLSDDKQLADADVDKDGVPDSKDDDGSFPDDAGGGAGGVDVTGGGGGDDGGAADAADAGGAMDGGGGGGDE